MKANGNPIRFVSSKEIGRAIRERRLALGISQEKLAEQLNVSYQQVQRYESGRNKLNVENIQAIAKTLDVHVTFFFNLDQIIVAESVKPYVSEDENCLVSNFRCIKCHSYKQLIIDVTKMAAKTDIQQK